MKGNLEPHGTFRSTCRERCSIDTLGLEDCYWAVAGAVAKFLAIYRTSHNRESYVSCCRLNIKCLLGAHVLKHLVPSWSRCLKIVEPSGNGDLIEELHHWGGL